MSLSLAVSASLFVDAAFRLQQLACKHTHKMLQAFQDAFTAVWQSKAFDGGPSVNINCLPTVHYMHPLSATTATVAIQILMFCIRNFEHGTHLGSVSMPNFAPEQGLAICRAAGKLQSIVTRLQAIRRGTCQRRAYLHSLAHIVHLQAAFRGFPARMQFLQAKGAAIWIQSCWRRHQAQTLLRQIKVCLSTRTNWSLSIESKRVFGL